MATEGEKIVPRGARKRPSGLWLRPEVSSGLELKRMASELGLLLPGVDPDECARLLRDMGHPERARKPCA